MDAAWFKKKWSQVMNNILELEPPTPNPKPAKVCISYASSFGSAIAKQIADSGMSGMVSVGILKGLRLNILKECHLTDDEVYLDCENLLKQPGTFIKDGREVRNDKWDVYYKQAQRECKVFLIYLTEGYFESQWCKMELDYAAQQRLPIVILTYDKTPTIKNDMLKIKQQHERAGGRVECFYYSFDDGDDDEKMSVVVKAIAKMLH